MRMSVLGRNELLLSEGLRLKAYKDTVGVWTIGVGTTSVNGVPVYPGMTCTREQAIQWMENGDGGLAEVETAINKLVKVSLNQNQFDALAHFVYNIGRTQFTTSTLLRLLNLGDYAGAAKQFLRWVKQPELKGRREKEKRMFEGK